MAELKTKKTSVRVEQFIGSIEDEVVRDDCYAIVEIMKSITKCEPAMWGSSIVGFGTYENITANGQKADWPVAAFSPRKQNLTIYLMPGFEKNTDLMKSLGSKYKNSKACLYVKRLEDLHIPTLKKLIKISIQDLNRYLATQKKAHQKKKK